MVPPLLELALDYYRDPLSYPYLTDDGQALSPGFEGMLVQFCGALSPARIEATAALLETDAAQLREAGRFFLRRVLLQGEGDHYRRLDLDREASPETIRMHYLLLMGLFHPDRDDPGHDLSVSSSARLNEAYRTLRDPVARAAYDRSLGASGGSAPTTVDGRAFRKRVPRGLRGLDADRGPVAVLSRRYRAGLILAITAVGAMAALALLVWPSAPQLRMRQPGVAAGAPVPHYMHDQAQPPAGAPGGLPMTPQAALPLVVPTGALAPEGR